MASVSEKRLVALHPTVFENLTFDLVRADRMENVNWRTPGADGGRDIEGELPMRDFAGHTRRFRWLIECKRYKAAVSWPTVWEKVAYADGSQADFLLLVTTGKFSTRCLDEIQKWNNLGRRPAIRVWPGHEVAYRLFLKPALAAKYDLLDGRVPSAVEVSSLSLHVSRMAQAALAHTDPVKLKRFVLAASNLANLLYVRSMDLADIGCFRASRSLARESVPTFITGVTTADLNNFDWAGVLAYFACLHMLTKTPLLVSKQPDETLLVTTATGVKGGLPDLDLMRETAFWGCLTVTQGELCLCLTPQIFS